MRADLTRPDDDRAVIARAQAGDCDAIEDLFHELDPVLCRYLTSSPGAHADDLVADVWLRVGRSFDSFSGGRATFRAWTFSIAHRRLLDERRTRQCRRADGQQLDEPAAAADTEAESEADREMSGRLGGTEAAELVRRVLPAGKADVVLLRVLGQFDVSEVAAIMHRSEDWVRVTLQRALRRLSDHLHTPGEVST